MQSSTSAGTRPVMEVLSTAMARLAPSRGAFRRFAAGLPNGAGWQLWGTCGGSRVMQQACMYKWHLGLAVDAEKTAMSLCGVV